MIIKQQITDIGVTSFRLPIKGKIQKIIIKQSFDGNRSYSLKIDDNQYLKDFRPFINQDNFIKDNLEFDENTLFEIDVKIINKEVNEYDNYFSADVYFIYNIYQLDFARN